MSSPREPPPELDFAAGLPPWATSVAVRLAFFARQRGGTAADDRQLLETLDALRRRTAEPAGDDRALRHFLDACLALLADTAATHPALGAIRDDLAALTCLARTAIEGDCDDRPLLERERALEELPGAVAFAASRVPGRVVWLAAMAAQVPDEEGAAAAMLVNDLAAVGADLPLRALQAAARG